CIVLSISVLFFFFFFFQAEDGIRDLYVTGVQTCALPIFGRPHFQDLAFPATSCAWKARSWKCGRPSRGPISAWSRCARPRSTRRSEERRVGKECRARGGREQDKKRTERNRSRCTKRG